MDFVNFENRAIFFIFDLDAVYKLEKNKKKLLEARNIHRA